MKLMLDKDSMKAVSKDNNIGKGRHSPFRGGLERGCRMSDSMILFVRVDY